MTGSDRSPNSRVVVPIGTALVEQFVAAMSQARIHELSHPRVATPVAAVQGCLRRLMGELGEEHTDFHVDGERLLLSGRMELPRSPATARFVHSLRARCAIGLRLSSEARPTDFATLFTILMSGAEPSPREAAARNRTVATGSERRIELVMAAGHERVDDEQDGEKEVEPDNRDPSAVVRTSARREAPTRETQLVTAARLAFTAAAEHADLSLTPVVEVVASFVERTLERGTAGMDLSYRGHEDPDGSWHAARTCALSIEAGRTLTNDVDALVELGVGALLHDIGEALLPDEVRRKGAFGEPEARAIWQTHSELGAEYLMGLSDVDPMWVAAALMHHRTHIGGGYPKTYHDHVQSPFTQLVRIADVYETLTAPVFHRDPLTPTHAFRTMVAARGGLSMAMLRRFIEALGLRPVGSVVRLTSGELARVIRRGDDLENPVVVVVATPQGRVIPTAKRRMLDLSRPSPGSPRLAGSN